MPEPQSQPQPATTSASKKTVAPPPNESDPTDSATRAIRLAKSGLESNNPFARANPARPRPPGEFAGHTVQSWEQPGPERTRPSAASKEAPPPEDGAPGALPARPQDEKVNRSAGGDAERNELSSRDVDAGPELAAQPGEGNTSENAAGPPSEAIAGKRSAMTDAAAPRTQSAPMRSGPVTPSPAATSSLVRPFLRIEKAEKTAAPIASTTPKLATPETKGEKAPLSPNPTVASMKPKGVSDPGVVDQVTAPSGVATRAPTTARMESAAELPSPAMEASEKTAGGAQSTAPKPVVSTRPAPASKVNLDQASRDALVASVCKELSELLVRAMRESVVKAVDAALGARSGEAAASSRPAAPDVVKPVVVKSTPAAKPTGETGHLAAPLAPAQPEA